MAEEARLPFLQKKKNKSSQLSIRLTDELRQDLEGIAKANDISLSHLIATLLESGVSETRRILWRAKFINSSKPKLKHGMLKLERLIPLNQRQYTTALEMYPDAKYTPEEKAASDLNLLREFGYIDDAGYEAALNEALASIFVPEILRQYDEGAAHE